MAVSGGNILRGEFVSGNRGWINLWLDNTTGILGYWANGASATPLQISAPAYGQLPAMAALTVMPYQELPNYGYKCRIVASVASAPVAASTLPICHPLFLRPVLGTSLGGCTFAAALVPTLSTATPNTAVHGASATSVALVGTNFVSGALVMFTPFVQSLSATWNSATSLTVVIPASYLVTAGTYGIVVVNPDGEQSNSLGFTVS